MTLHTAAAISLVLLAAASAGAGQARASEASEPPSASPNTSPTITITRSGSQPSRRGPTQNFTGSVRIDPLFDAKEPSRTSGAYVTFEPGARTAWHTHPLGQTLIVTAGTGRVQRWGDPVEEIRSGDVVRIPPGQKHWHGASPTTPVTHIAIQEYANGKSVDWMEHVSDEQYKDLSFTLLHPGFSLHDELQALVDVGLTPAEALRAATLYPAQLFPNLDAGEVAAGKRANLLLLDGNPLEEIRNAGRIRAVVLAGRIYDRAALNRLLAEAAAQALVN